MHALPLTRAFITEAWMLENRLRAEMTKDRFDSAAQSKCNLLRPDKEARDHQCMHKDKTDPNNKPLTADLNYRPCILS